MNHKAHNSPNAGGGELPSGQDIVRQLEDYFRERSLGQDDESSSEPRPN